MKHGTQQVIKGIKRRKRDRFIEDCKGLLQLVLIVGMLFAIACYVY